METKFRCNCPFTTALDILGDKWMLVIVKQMLMENKQTFKDFTESDEGIATNILTTKLKQLEAFGIITKTKLPNNKKSNIYLLTEKGLAMTPIIVELGIWSDNHLRDFNPTIVNEGGIELLRSNKAEFTKIIVQQYREKMAASHLNNSYKPKTKT
ncbi:transcriptional regulator [Winogradskyella sp. J14-2]|uniref:winged helix-turn-helix transcriptional regulator n=1 Tax=Winogradskyella sp. J14-2 TaxID=1936080 RepID=UPI0009726FC3|nr:helix-turn-helix domain-containing protein [Winogradskyella sp. J14-2]APY09658.1 transcriptional regulator [Winogradskyella sp. J14-2]